MSESAGQAPSAARIDVPRLPSGRVQRKMPAPFARPSISIGVPPHQQREWRHVLACDLGEGDTVPGLGLLGVIRETHSGGADGWSVHLEGAEGRAATFSATASVFAFVPRVRG